MLNNPSKSLGLKYFKQFNSSAFMLALGFVLCAHLTFAEENKDSPIIINGDNVEYSTDSKEVTATGNIEVTYKGSKLTCNKLKVNMLTKVGFAEGNAKLEDAKGIVTGERITYDFQNKTGVILNADFRANPYFGKAKKVEKVSESEYADNNGYFTTCNLDHPHYRFAAKKIGLFPGDKIQAQQATLYLGAVPFIYLPRFNYSMKEPLMKMQTLVGKRKDWGPYILNTWRYNLTEHVNAKLFIDYRYKLGFAEGLGLNYDTLIAGKGDFKFYYTKEVPYRFPPSEPEDFQRFFIRWRHKWDIDPRTNLTTEFYKITDKRWKYDNKHNLLQDYFFREYEKDSQPLTYALFHRAFNYSSIDILIQKRTNHWFDQLDKNPEINYNLPSLQLGETPFYFENVSQLGNYNKKKTVGSDPTAATYSQDRDDVTDVRLDTKNTLSLPTKIAFVQFKPFVTSRQTYYNKSIGGQTGIVRTIFSSGADMSTKFYRVFDAKTNFLGLDINSLRHIITPTIGYLYTHPPTIPASKLWQIDGVDSTTRGNTATLGLSNKLQTKRSGQSLDLIDFLITTNYVLDPKKGDNGLLTPREGDGLKNNFTDILFNLKVLPYSWLRWESDATFAHANHADVNYNKFSLANYTLTFDFKESSFFIGQRYERKGKNEVTAGFDWRLSPKWKFSVYQRYNFKPIGAVRAGLREQQYTLTRDLHCWDFEFSFNKTKTQGSTIFFTFRLKAFPENDFGFEQMTHKVKSGSQIYK